MNAIKAIFAKQMNDFPKNVSVSLLYILHPVMAVMMAQFMEAPKVYMTTLFASMFIGSTPMIAICNTVAEDNENKSLRFLIMAGVKPWQYLLGLGGFVLLMSIIPVAAFIFIGGFSGKVLINYIIAAALGCIASSILGGIIGIFSGNVQQATAIYTPAMILLAILPIIASANDTIERIAELLFSYQVIMIVLNPKANIAGAFMVMIANIVVLLILFVFAYKKKGLKG